MASLKGQKVRIPTKSNADSGRSRTVIPGMADTRSGVSVE